MITVPSRPGQPTIVHPGIRAVRPEHRPVASVGVAEVLQFVA